jgi:Domain of unknown function (DUF4347)/Bacterial Ig-like domain
MAKETLDFFNQTILNNFNYLKNSNPTSTQIKKINMQKLPTTLVVIDSHVEDYQALEKGVLSGIQVHILDANRDGIEQITEVLNQHEEIANLHIVSHGAPGCLYLGNTELSLDTLEQYTNQLKTWFSSASGRTCSPTLLLYGCNVAAGDAGAEFIAKLNQITGTKIAASTTPTGNAAKGGDWNLEITTHNDPLELAFTDKVKAEWQGILALSITSDAITEDTTPVIAGLATPGAFVMLEVGADEVTYFTSADPVTGQWSVDLETATPDDGEAPTLEDGETLEVTVTSRNENNVPESVTQILTNPTVNPVIPATKDVAENTTVVELPIIDTDGSNITYSLTGMGADAAKFAINADGKLAFAAAPDFEAKASAAGTNAYQVEVRAVDGFDNATIKLITVNVTDVDEVPPLAPTVNPIENTDGKPMLTGTYDAVDTDKLTVKVNDVIYTSETNPVVVLDAVKGIWSLDLTNLFQPIPNGTYDVTVTATDKAGNPISDLGTEDLIISPDGNQDKDSNLDIDGNGKMESSDYTLINLYAGFGSDAALFDVFIEGNRDILLGTGATRVNGEQLTKFLDIGQDVIFDVDGNSKVESSDYTLIELYGSFGDPQVLDVFIEESADVLLGQGATRTSGDEIFTYLDQWLPTASSVMEMPQ